MNQYKCDYFKIQELVDPDTYKARGQKAWELFSPELLIAIDGLRVMFGPAIINDWKFGGRFKWSGFRSPACRIGAKLSQHRFGRACDMKFKNVSAKEVRKHIRSDPAYYIGLGITCIENKVSWLHVSVQNCEPIKWINP